MKKVFIITCEHADHSKVIMAVKKSRRRAIQHLNWLLDWRFRQWGWTVLQQMDHISKRERTANAIGAMTIARVLTGNSEQRHKYSEWLEVQEWEVTDDVPAN